MKRELKPEEHEEIVRAVAAGDRVKATNIYFSATEGNRRQVSVEAAVANRLSRRCCARSAGLTRAAHRMLPMKTSGSSGKSYPATQTG